MSFLGLVGVPASPIAYQAYQALKAISPVLGAAFAASEAAAIAALAAQGAAVLGAGALGWVIGTAIRGQLGLDATAGDLSSYTSGGNPGEQYVVKFTFYSEPSAPINSELVATAPFVGVLRETIGSDQDRFFLRNTTTGQKFAFIDFGPSLNPRARLQVNSFTKLDGSPAPELFRIPVAPAKPPYVPVRIPTIIPATPTSPAFPITPVVVPTPGNDPDEDDKLVEPAITVQIPELGLQIQYTPTGVRIGGYRSPETVPFTPPKVPLPPNVPKVASDPCPCPEKEPESDEVICRIKTLQDEILNDGYTFTTSVVPEGVGGSVSNIQAELVQANVFLSTFPLNVSRQYYQALDSDVIYGGWFSWTKEGRAGERIPLSFENNSFYPPPEADGFKYAFNRGCSGSGSYVTRVKKDYVDNC